MTRPQPTIQQPSAESAHQPFHETAPAAFRPDTSTNPGATQESFGPMDLVCRRVPAEPSSRSSIQSIGAGQRSSVGDACVLVVRLPNPNHPHTSPPVHRHHSTDDVTTVQAWGYAGSGPADLALNVLAAYLPVEAEGTGRAIKLWDGSYVSEKADRHHQAFKSAFLTRMPDAGGVVTEAEVRAWLAEQETLSLADVA
jgi:hypothetical protein